MPIIKSAIKKVRKDKVRTERNKVRETIYKNLIKKTRKQANSANLKAVFSALDKAVKVKLIHKNKASRIKSRLAKGSTQTATKPVVKKSKSKSGK